MRVLFAAALTLLLAGCIDFGTDTNSPPDAKQYYVNKDGETCTVDPVKGSVVVSGPWATRDEAKADKGSNSACKAAETPAQ